MRRLIETDQGWQMAEPISEFINRAEWESYREARAKGMRAEEPVTLRSPDADSTVASDLLIADFYRMKSLNYAGLEIA